MSLYTHITCPIVGVAGGAAHATKARYGVKRKTYDAACGKRVKLLAHPTTDGGHITQPWPPYAADAKEWGLTRCPDCLREVPGKPQRLQLAPIEESA